ncbi:4-(cytidine 5'-diphospho)-2-C-methyl-D-erythritol kinase [Candidatus Tachikawaea gelatinosa]|uniref:hypothetical protein n=1 Tax=Candidatus Tachikawaea gelatinosa TaxID=1410383 RepID=UPI000694E985|nr:hypothetical protein [Candidatus Tachikawaea gelatinosa]
MKNWLSPAKLNLFFYINNKKHGYHNIKTLFQILDYNDTLSISVNHSEKINIIDKSNKIPLEKNLILHAAKILFFFAEKKKYLN